LTPWPTCSTIRRGQPTRLNRPGGTSVRIRRAGVAAVGSAGPQEHPGEVRWMDPDAVRKHRARTTCLASSGEYSADLGSSVL
jgi:hypothetical protein